MFRKMIYMAGFFVFFVLCVQFFIWTGSHDSVVKHDINSDVQRSAPPEVLVEPSEPMKASSSITTPTEVSLKNMDHNSSAKDSAEEGMQTAHVKEELEYIDPNLEILRKRQEYLEHQKELDEMAAFKATEVLAQPVTRITYPDRSVD